MKTALEVQDVFSNAIGTENWYKHWTKRGYFTDGVMEVAMSAEAHWLIDAIFSYARKEEFQLWLLRVNEGKAFLNMQEDSDTEVLVTQYIEYTDFPEGTWKFYLENGVLMLPGER